MTKYRVKAYFMHEHEERAAREAASKALIQSPEWTPSYVMGVVDQADIAKLQAGGLIVTPVEKITPTPRASSESAGRTGVRKVAKKKAAAKKPAQLSIMQPLNVPMAMSASRKRPLSSASTDRTPAQKILSRDRQKAQFYIVRLHGPLTEERRAVLDGKKIKLLERVTRNKYTVRLEPAQLSVLASLSFVDVIRMYSETDTLPRLQEPLTGTQPTGKKPEAAWRRRTCVYAVRLHRAKDMPAVVAWLAEIGRKPLWKGEGMLRVALVEGSRDLRRLANLPEVALVEQMEAPRLFDSSARELLGLDQFSKPPLGLEGDGEIVAIADTGIDDAHPDFQGRLAGIKAWGRKNNHSDPEGHGTHVAGCVAGDGKASNGQVVGAAPRAKLFFQSILDKNGALGGLPPDLAKLFKEAHQAGARIHNNSWGAFTFARYALSSLQVDRFVADHPDMLIVIAAGNDGIGVPRVNGAKMSATAGFVDWPSVAAPATAKNGLTVGASRNSRTHGGYSKLKWGEAWAERYPKAPISKETISGDHQCLAAFSSRGPCDDQRIKPDVVAPGTDIAAAKSKDAPLHKFWGAYPANGKYGFMGGTSMAAPYVAGCAALVREWYRKKENWQQPSAALLKATLINGARRITGWDSGAPPLGEPNFHQGFGRIDMTSTVPNHSAPGLKLVFDDTWTNPARQLGQTGQGFRYRLTVGSGLTLRLCLTWTDPPARGLQNSLVLLVDDGGQKWIGNAGAASLLNIAGATADPNNNTQIVRIATPKAGDYTIVVAAAMLLLPPQSFALVATGELKSALQKI